VGIVGQKSVTGSFCSSYSMLQLPVQIFIIFDSQIIDKSNIPYRFLPKGYTNFPAGYKQQIKGPVCKKQVSDNKKSNPWKSVQSVAILL
jgi:hypothetical protein